MYDLTETNKINLPTTPDTLPKEISDTIRELGRMWATSDLCPTISQETATSWSKLIEAWAAEPTLPLLIRKGSSIRGSEIIHRTGRILIPCDNSPAQWACYLALQGITPTLEEIKYGFKNDSIPISFAHKVREKELRKYHCTLGKFSVNRLGWKLCHIKPIGLKSRTSLSDIEINKLLQAFNDLLNPENHFLIPIQWSGLGEVPEFIEGYTNRNKK